MFWLNAAEVVELDSRYSICTLAFLQTLLHIDCSFLLPTILISGACPHVSWKLEKGAQADSCEFWESQQGGEAVSGSSKT